MPQRSCAARPSRRIRTLELSRARHAALRPRCRAFVASFKQRCKKLHCIVHCPVDDGTQSHEAAEFPDGVDKSAGGQPPRPVPAHAAAAAAPHQQRLRAHRPVQRTTGASLWRRTLARAVFERRGRAARAYAVGGGRPDRRPRRRWGALSTRAPASRCRLAPMPSWA